MYLFLCNHLTKFILIFNYQIGYTEIQLSINNNVTIKPINWYTYDVTLILPNYFFGGEVLTLFTD